MNRKKWKTLSSYAIPVTLLTIVGLAFAAHFNFHVSQPFDAEEDINEAAVQTRAGQLNVAKAVGDTVFATFSNDQCGSYVRTLLISSNAFLQTSGPVDCTLGGGGGGGGGCAIQDPSSSILTVDGQRSVLAQVGQKALTRRGSAEDGRSIVLDEYAVVRLGRKGAALLRASDGFQQSPALMNALSSQLDLDRLQVHSEAQAKARVSGDGTVLVIQHQREHPANHNFAPVPDVTFEPQPYADALVQGQSGFAVVAFGESGHVLNVEILTARGINPPGSLATAISNGSRTQFKDERRHDHRAYVAYRIDAGMVQRVGRPIVTLPMCCHCGEAICNEN
jgi:hypothetical protein